jgi:hypothetical protein
LKEWLSEHCETEGKEIGHVITDLLEEQRQKAGGNPLSLEKKLERQLLHVDEELEELEDESNKRLYRLRVIARKLSEAYPEMNGDFIRIRLKALEDFRRSQKGVRAGSGPDEKTWMRRVQSQSEIIASCRLAASLTELRNRRSDLQSKLRACYGMSAEASAAS